MSGHTSGPWTTRRATNTTDGAYDYAVVADGQIIGEAFGRSGTTSYHNAEANANMFAAAPDLLTACKLALEEFVGAVVRTSEVDETFRAIESAIAKAEGR